MCSRIFFLLLAAMMATVAVTVAAFIYLQWWQAILATATFLAVLFWGGKFLLRAAIQFWGEQLTKLTTRQAVVLRNATLQIHKVERSHPPRELTSDEDDDFEDDDADLRRERADEAFSRAWYKIELTLFPNPDIEESTQPWTPELLTFVDDDREPPRNLLNVREYDGVYTPARLKILTPDPRETGGELTGPHRMRFLVGIPHTIRAVAMRYLTEQFGRIVLPRAFDDTPQVRDA